MRQPAGPEAGCYAMQNYFHCHRVADSETGDPNFWISNLS
jgi:hypothetical protein